MATALETVTSADITEKEREGKVNSVLMSLVIADLAITCIWVVSRRLHTLVVLL